jgi:hypothetical protein
MFLKLIQGRFVRGFGKQIHTQMCLTALFDQRRKVENDWKNVENEWEDDEHEQKRAFHEEDTRVQKQQQQRQQQQRQQQQRQQQHQHQQLKCVITGKAKHPGSLDCSCKGMCMARKSETHLIHHEGSVGIITKK